MSSTDTLRFAFVSPRIIHIAVNLLVIALLIFSLTQWWKRITPASDISINQSHLISPAVNTPNPLDSIVTAELFGRYEPDTGISQSIPQLTSLQMVLNGVFAAGQAGLALISRDRSNQESFAVGDEVAPGVKLIAVLPDHILMQRGAQIDYLPLHGYEKEVIPQNVTSLTTPNPDKSQTLTRQFDANRSPGNFQVSRKKLGERFRSPHELISQVVMMPNRGGGYLLREIQSGSMIGELGLQKDDVIVAVNGFRLYSADDLMSAYRQVRNQNNVRLEIQRNGKKEFLQYEVQ